jgi:hypothetical protein
MFRIFAWIPDIFPEIQEKFREDGSIIHSCNKAIRGPWFTRHGEHNMKNPRHPGNCEAV